MHSVLYKLNQSSCSIWPTDPVHIGFHTIISQSSTLRRFGFLLALRISVLHNKKNTTTLLCENFAASLGAIMLEKLPVIFVSSAKIYEKLTPHKKVFLFIFYTELAEAIAHHTPTFKTYVHRAPFSLVRRGTRDVRCEEMPSI